MSSSEFIKCFKPERPDHVMWLKQIYDLAKANSPTILSKFVDNPLGVRADPKDKEFALGWIEIHFGLGMKYAQAVLEHKAWIPNK